MWDVEVIGRYCFENSSCLVYRLRRGVWLVGGIECAGMRTCEGYYVGVFISDEGLTGVDGGVRGGTTIDEVLNLSFTK